MQINYFSIYTDKLEETIKFYTDFLEFNLERRVQASEKVTLVFLNDGKGGNIELVDQGIPVEEPKNNSVAITIVVDNVEDIEKKANEAGYIKSFGPQKMPSGVTLLHIMDPNNVTINFVEMGDMAH